ncbi:uncharacterized protein LOC101863532 [Aplysia californica]|uniref:Uncharacterized protein LOC101863532 n=1 Tax=Aplysia californica TaxID=6500 RepID=A0ABM0K0D6_APLCA|nr:uncharacterized protein LOC101863532 [Aplysia californica]
MLILLPYSAERSENDNITMWALVFLSVVATIFCRVESHTTPCNQGNDTMCLLGVREEFIGVNRSYWFADKYYSKRCPGGPDGSFLCMNMAPDRQTIASRLLNIKDGNFSAETVEQFLHIRYNTPKGMYMACGHRYDVEEYVSTKDLDNTHTIYTDMWVLNHKPSITFSYTVGETYTLVAYDAGHMRLGGLWVNIKSGDASTGQEVIAHSGPVNPAWTMRNPFVYALFRQRTGSDIIGLTDLRKQILQQIKQNDGHFLLDNLIREKELEGPVGIGLVVVKTDAYSIQHFVDKNVFNNCPYLASKNQDLIMALQVMGYGLTDENSYSDYRGTFLTEMEVDVQMNFVSPEAHFDSCCKHHMYPPTEMKVDPFSDKPIMPVYTRFAPHVDLSSIEMTQRKQFDDYLGIWHTLLLLDITDAIRNVSDPDVVVHWQVMNVRRSYPAQRGDVVHEYLPPVPREAEDTRTFLLLVLRQSSRVDARAVWLYTGGQCSMGTEHRCKFDFAAFQKHLNFRIAGLAYFHSRQDAFARSVMFRGLERTNSTQDAAQVCAGVPGYADPCPSPCPV